MCPKHSYRPRLIKKKKYPATHECTSDGEIDLQLSQMNLIKHSEKTRKKKKTLKTQQSAAGDRFVGLSQNKNKKDANRLYANLMLSIRV